MKSVGFSSSDLLINPQDLVSNLGRRMDNLLKAQPTAGNKIWTSYVKAFLAEIAQEIEATRQDLSIEVLFTNPVKGVSEFLLDVVWWCRRTSEKPDEFMGLAVEIEWGSFYSRVQDVVGEDFGKLTVVKSPLKLMIFCTDMNRSQMTHAPQQQLVIDEIDRYLTTYAHHIPGEHYVLIDVASYGHMRAWQRSVDEDGQISSLSEIQINYA